MKFPKHSVSSLTLSSIILTLANTSSAQTIERSQIPSTTFNAPLPVAPFGTQSFPLFPATTTWHSLTRFWGYGAPGNAVVPSIAFLADDNKGLSAADMCGTNFPKHLGTDYAAPAGTMVYAIADGKVRRVNGFTVGLGDYYVVVESGNNEKWTTLYGHLNNLGSTMPVGKIIKKGDPIGTLFNFREGGDVPHLHLGIRLSEYVDVPYTDVRSSTRGFACQANVSANNNYKFTSPEALRYITNYW